MISALLHSTKYDGSLHYRFPTRIVREAGHELIVYTPPGTLCDSYRGPGPLAWHMLGIFWRDRDFNFELMWEADWRPKQHYVNIATPATWGDGVVRYVDLDLDVRKEANSTDVLVDDADEFEQHRRDWAYPPELQERCHAAVEEVHSLFRRGEWPFVDGLYAWRPGQPI